MVEKTLIGGFDVNGQSFAFINFAKLASGQAAVTANFAYPSVLDTNGYPNNSGASLAGEFGTSVFVPHTLIGTGNLVVKWVGDGAIRFNQNNTMAVSSKSGCTTNSDSTTNLVITSSGSGSSPRVVLSMAAGMESRLDVRFPISKTYTNMSGLVICRESQESTLDGGEIFNPDFIALLTLLNPRVLRLMDWNAVNGSLVSRHDYQHPVAAFAYRNARWDPRAWAGTATLSSNAYACDAVPSDFNGTLVHGATVQAQIGSGSGNSANQLAVTGTANNGSGVIRAAMADTSSLTTGQRAAFFETSNGYSNGAGVWTITVIDGTHIDFDGSTFSSNAPGTLSTTTFSCNGSTAKLLCGQAGAVTLSANALCTFVYNSIFDAWIAVPRGMGGNSENGAVPVEVQVSLCNELNVHYYTNFHFDYTDASVQAQAEYIRDNLATGLLCYFEYSNEVWNTGAAFVQTNKANALGAQFGFPLANGEQYYGWYGLRVRQIMGIVTTAYAVTSNQNYRRVMAFQAFGSTTNTQKYRWEGFDLVAGNAKYNTWTGSTSYNSSPNRPIDYCDVISYATYFYGAVLSSGVYGVTGTYTGLQSATDSYVADDTETAFDWCDADLRSGTSTISGQGAETVSDLATICAGWEAKADDYDGSRSTPLGVICYEGGYEALAPTADQCVTIGLTGYSPDITAMLADYKRSTQFLQTCTLQARNVIDAHAARPATPAWFALQGASKWSMMEGNTYAAKFTSFDAHRLLNSDKRRIRVSN